MKIAVIGNGSIGRRHLRGLSANLKHLGITEIRGYDTNPDRRLLVKEETPNVVVAESLGSALEGIDTVFMCVPTALHMPIYQQTKPYGNFHFFIEKPLSHTLEGCENMLFEQRKLGMKVAVGYMMHYHPVLKRAKEFIESGTLGRIHLLEPRVGFICHFGTLGKIIGIFICLGKLVAAGHF